MAESTIPAAGFAAATDRVCAHRGLPVVVKLGGSAMEDPHATTTCLHSVATLNKLGVPILIVHGGGKPIDRAMAEAGLVPRKVAGRRYTDEATLEIVVRVLQEIGRDITARLNALGATAALMPKQLTGSRLFLSDESGQSVDLGRVGVVTHVDTNILDQVCQDCGVPVIPSIALHDDGGWLNVNADTAAAAVAGAVHADKAIFLTDTPGVLRDRNDSRSLIQTLSEGEARALITSGVIEGGMVPKVEACFEALNAGAKSALILDGRVHYSLLDVYLHDSFTGTIITR